MFKRHNYVGFLQTLIKNHSSNLKKFFIFKAKFIVFMQILFVMGFRSGNAVPVRHDKIFHSGLPERARSSCRMSMEFTNSNCYLVNPPDTTTVLAHQINNMLGTFNRVEVDGWVVTKAQLVDILLYQVKVILVAVIVFVTNVFGAPLAVVVIGTRIHNNNVKRNPRQRSSPWMGSL